MDFVSHISPYLHSGILGALSRLPDKDSLTELRLSLERFALVSARGKPRVLVDSKGRAVPLDKTVFSYTLDALSRGSLYSISDGLGRGYVTIEGGHRVGLCGTAVMTDSRVTTARDISDICFRICREVPGCGWDIYCDMCRTGRVESSLIASPPGYGKTTVLRDLCRCIATGSRTVAPVLVGIADERCEIAAMHRGVSAFDLGSMSFVCSGYPKAYAMLLMLRSMAPSVLATDEVGSREEFLAIAEARKCGVSVVATVHAMDIEDLRQRFKGELAVFSNIYFIRNKSAGFDVFRRCQGDY